MNKNGQASSLIILGFIVLLIFFLLLYFMSSNKPIREVINLQLQEILDEVDDKIEFCLRKLTKEGVDNLHLNGGFIDLEASPVELLEFSFPESKNLRVVAHGLWKKENFLVTKEGLEIQLSSYLAHTLPLCLDLKGFKGEYDEAVKTFLVKVSPEKISINLDYPLVFKKNGFEAKTKGKYEIMVGTDLEMKRQIAEKIVLQQIKYNGMIDLVSVLSWGYNINFIPVDNSTFVFLIQDKAKITLPFMFGSSLN